MPRKLLIYLSITILTASAVYLARAAETEGFREKLVRFIEKSSSKSDPGKSEDEADAFIGDEESSPFYRKGDWSEYTSDKNRYNYLNDPDRGNVYSDENMIINAYGNADFKLKYGKSFFTDKKYKQFDEDKPFSKIIENGFLPEQVIKLHVEGSTGDRISVYVDHDSTREENSYIMKYRALSDDEIIREVNAGDIDINFNDSRFAVYDNTDARGLGVDFTVGRGDFMLKAFGSITKGEAAVEYFKGNTSAGSIKLSDYQYIRKSYYQLEPFVRYDGVTVVPSGSAVYSLVAVTSSPADPSSYVPYPVNISSAGFALYIDDQNQYNNYNAVQLSLDGGFYTRFVNGTDYTINYTTGVIRIIKDIPENARIFAVYNRSGGTLDPCAIPEGDPRHPGGDFAGKIFVFLKYGYSINEDIVSRNLSFDSGENDVNRDGRVNIDIYEIRSNYYLGAKNIVSGNLVFSFLRENSTIEDSEKAALSQFKIDYSGGIMLFNLREPFKRLLGNSSGYIYSEPVLSNTYLYSRYIIQADYAVEARSFQLQHGNIIENSVRIRVNGREIPVSLYSVDYTSGYFTFTSPDNPVIGPDTQVEVKYEYLPLGQSSGNFAGGLRGDYNFSRDFRIGGSVLVSRGAESESIPDIGSETEQTLMLEGDASLKLTKKRLTDFFRSITGSKKAVPAEMSFYAEYAKSIKDINTFGKALIDNMESSEETVHVSLSEKDWILSSMPSGYSQSDRGILNYYFYRSPGSPESLKGPAFSAYKIDYSVKPGPFNIATGHVADNIISESSQRSLVFDFDLSQWGCFSVVTRKLFSEATDLSGAQYVEVWLKYESAGANDTLNLFMELGSVSEDSDGDGSLDTEDLNSNGYIDSEPSKGYSEDRGYVFNGNNPTVVGSGPGLNSSTMGDGILSTEDLDGDGVLDTADSVYRISLGTVGVNGGGWQKVRVYLDRSALTSSQIDILKQTQNLRFFAVRSSGTTGRLFIDSMKIITSKWKSAELDGAAVYDPDIVKATMVDSINDSDYRADSFLIRERGLYESLYGSDSTDDIDSVSESALQVEYDIPAGSEYIALTRRFAKPLDLRQYNTMNAWINTRSTVTGYVGFILGSSDYDYVEFRTIPSMISAWEELKFKLNSESSGSIDSYTVTGTPDMRRIKYLKIKLTGGGSSGKIWFNDIYVSDPEKLEGDAKWYECQLKILKPLAETGSGVPVMSDVDMKYIYKGISSSFSSLNRTSEDISERYHELLSSAKILPNWDANADYIFEHSVSDPLDENLSSEKRGDVTRNLFIFNSVFASTGGSVPSVSVNYSYDKNRGDKDLDVSGIDYRESGTKTVHSPVISWTQEFGDFLFGRLVSRFTMKMLFSEDRVSRDSSAGSAVSLSDYVTTLEAEKKQEGDASIQFDYSSGSFYLKPSMNMASSEVVEWEGKTDSSGINNSFEGGYHIPFSQERDMKYLLRNNGAGFVTGFTGMDFLSPEYNISVDCRENGFADYSFEGAETAGFARSKNSVSTLTTDLKIPVHLKKISIFENVKFMQINYSRSLIVTETDVPYEGEGTDYFDEEYGISRILSETSGSTFNFLKYYPGINFKGRGNYGRGRDLVYSTMNKNLTVMEENSSIEYDNSMKLTENFSADISVNWGAVDLGLRSGLGQICERGNLYGIPDQVVTATGGVDLDFDLMKIFSAGFFRSNRADIPYHASTLTVGADCSDSMLITQNIDEKKISPEMGITFKIDRCSFGLKGSVDFRKYRRKEFIDYNLSGDDRDYIYLSNMEGVENFSEEDTGYKFTAFYETDVKWIYDYFATFYKLSGLPIFSMEYSMEIDRYDYTRTVSPEPYDLHLLKSVFSMDIHKNVKGGMTGRMALEKFRNRENEGVSREIFSYEISANFSLIF